MHNFKIKKLFPSILISEIPEITFKALQPISSQISFKIDQTQYNLNYSDLDRHINVQDLPKNLYEKLYRFQEQGIEFAIKNSGRILIADEMGVGKTIQALSLSYLYKNVWPLLIICPSSLILNWRDELKKWLNKSIKNSQIQIIQKSSCEIRPDANIIIISYDLCSKLDHELNAKNFGVAIVDEAHYLKNALAKRTEKITPILQKIKHVLLLTGTPALAKPRELYTLLHILRPDIFKYFKDFGNRYCDPKPSKWARGLDYDGASNVRELYFLLNTNLMIRRLKKDVLSELPSKRRQKIEINVDAKISAEIQKLLSKNSDLDSFLDDIMEINHLPYPSDPSYEDLNKVPSFLNKQQINETLNRCYLLTGLAKLKGINQYISDITENECKFLIFAHHTEVMDGIEAELVKLKLNYIRIDGSISMNKRHDLVQQFQENIHIRIALLSISATGIGLTLTAASTILFAEMHWTPAIMLQAEDRAHRIGQINSVNCHYLYGGGTLDDKLYSKLDHKLVVVSEMIDGLGKDLEVEDYLKKGDMGAVSHAKLIEVKQKRSSSAAASATMDQINLSDEKITNFFRVIGNKTSQISTEKKKSPTDKALSGSKEMNEIREVKELKEFKEAKEVEEISKIKEIKEIKEIQKVKEVKEFKNIEEIKEKTDNYSIGSDLPDLELLDKLVEECQSSSIKKINVQANEKENKKVKDLLTIEGFRQVFKKEFKNNLMKGEVIEISGDSNNSVNFEKKAFINFQNLEKPESQKKKKRNENISLQNIYSEEKAYQNFHRFKD